MKKELPWVVEKNIERKAGLFILITVVAILIVFFVIGKEKNIFKKMYNLTTTFSHGGNIDKNTRITLAGLKAGNVVAIFINDEKNVEVEMEIQKEYQGLIREDSVATLVSSLLKGSVIDINIGSSESRILENGDRILSAEAAEIADKVGVSIIIPKSSDLEELVKKDMPALLEKIDKVFGIIDNLMGRLGDSSSNLNKLISNVEMFSRELNENNVIEKGSSLLENAGKLTTNMAGGFPDLLNKFNVLVEEANMVLNNLKVISGNLKEKSPELSDIIDSAGNLMYDVNDVIDASKKSFLLKKHLRKINEQQIMVNDDKRELLLE